MPEATCNSAETVPEYSLHVVCRRGGATRDSGEHATCPGDMPEEQAVAELRQKAVWLTRMYDEVRCTITQGKREVARFGAHDEFQPTARNSASVFIKTVDAAGRAIVVLERPKSERSLCGGFVGGFDFKNGIVREMREEA